MNQGFYGPPGIADYTDHILSSNLTAGTPWNIPCSIPPDCTVEFDFELEDAGSGAAYGIFFRLNGLADASHVTQAFTATGTSVSASSQSTGNFATLEVNGICLGQGKFLVGRRRIVWNNQVYRGIPGTSIYSVSFTGIVGPIGGVTLATQPFANAGIQQLQIAAPSGVIGRGSRFRLYKPLPVQR